MTAPNAAYGIGPYAGQDFAREQSDAGDDAFYAWCQDRDEDPDDVSAWDRWQDVRRAAL